MQEKQVYDRLDAMGINLVHLDVRRHDVTGFCDKAKVSRKDKPSFFLRAEDSLHKIPANTVNEDFPEGIQQELNRIANNRLIWSVKDLYDALKQNNTQLDSLTMVYYYNPDNYDEAQIALRLLRHESQHQVLELRDKEVAERM